jgi:peptidoglycan/xylan/chitin deacetylase (PgdA/CDA1 family)
MSKCGRLAASAIIPLLVLSLVNTSVASDQSQKTRPKEICITFDALPMAQSFTEIDRQLATEQILKALKQHQVKAAGFVVGKNLEDDFDLLGEWLNDGHTLGNLTFTHQDLHELDFENFINDVITCQEALEPILSGFGQEYRYFRYPFLHYGDNLQSKRQVAGYLIEQDIVTAHATVVIEDYLYNLSLEKLGNEADTAQYWHIMQEYVNHVLDRVEAMEMLSQEILLRPCRQILQLRASRLNAAFLDELLTALEQAGYRFVTLDQALDDALYTVEEAYFGARGVGYLEMVRQSNPDFIPAE